MVILKLGGHLYFGCDAFEVLSTGQEIWTMYLPLSCQNTKEDAT